MAEGEEMNTKGLITTIKRDSEKLGLNVRTAAEIENHMEFISTGSLVLNQAIGVEGYPCGMLTEIVGPSQSGKSVLTLIAEGIATRQKKIVLHLDNEGNHQTVETNNWRETFGIDQNYVIQFEPDTAEKLMEATRKTLKKLGNHCKLVVVDSINAFVSEKMVSKEMGESTVAAQAKLLHEWFDKLRVENKHAAILLINQQSTKIGGYGNPVSKGGGYAMKYDPHLSLSVYGEQIYTKKSQSVGAVGIDFTIKVVKNKLAAPGKVAKPRFLVEAGGFDLLPELVSMAVEHGLMERSLPWYYLGEKRFQGLEKVCAYLREKPKTVKKILVKLGFDPKGFGL